MHINPENSGIHFFYGCSLFLLLNISISENKHNLHNYNFMRLPDTIDCNLHEISTGWDVI